MREFLIDQAAPYGIVANTPVFSSNPCDYGYSSKPLGPNTVRNNNGMTQVGSLANRAPNAPGYAHRDQGNPFAPIGMKF